MGLGWGSASILQATNQRRTEMNSSKSTPANSQTGLQLRTLIKSSGELEMSLHDIPSPALADDEVLIRVEGSPINPSDIGLLFGAADMSTAVQSGTATHPVITAKVPEAFMKAMAGRADESMPAGYEGAGTVIAAGASPAAQALMGKMVAAFGGAMYTQFRAVKVDRKSVV